MYRNITVVVFSISAVILFYLANKYSAVSEFKLAAAEDRAACYEAAIDKFWYVGIVISFINMVWVEIVVIKTRQLYWLWVPFLMITAVVVANTYQEEQLFHFKKANGLWKGGFSLSYFFCIAIILIAAFVLLANYFAFRKYFTNENHHLDK